MRKLLIALTLVVLIVMAQLIATTPIRKSLRAQLSPNYVRAMAAFKRLEPKLPRNELRAITTIGVLNGAQQAEQQVEKHLIDIVKDLVINMGMTDKDNILQKVDQIENQLIRDQHALVIITSALDLVTGTKNAREFKKEMQQVLEETRRQATVETPLHDKKPYYKKEHDQMGQDIVQNVDERVAGLRHNILKQVNTMKSLLADKIEHTLDFLINAAEEDGLLAKASKKIVRKRDVGNWREEPVEISMIKSIFTEDDFRTNLIDDGAEKRKDEFDSLEDDLELRGNLKKGISNRSIASNSTMVTTNQTVIKLQKAAKQEEGSPEILIENEEPADGGGGGGLVGIISSLSGGEGGSDVGALIGALTGLVSTLFGPGGLDIESLISTATSLISGLLSGNKNFGTVLGQYVGTALDGLSGGGGAVNNGQFIGNFLGTVVASLSADPEDDDEPPKPLIFAHNLFSSFVEAKNRKASAEVSEERRSDHNKGGQTAGGGGSDSAGFIKHIVSHVVGSVVSLILNASLGASGGASHASSTLFAGSSAGHKPAGGVKSWQ